MTPSHRSGICNGIWLCSNCADMIDRDAERYTAALLHNWKYKAETSAQAEQGKPLPSARELAIFKTRALGENVTGRSIGDLLTGVQHIAIQEIERLDPRFAAKVGFSEEGHPLISLNPREPVNCRLCVPLEIAAEFAEKLSNLQSHGHRFEIDASGMQIDGTPIFGEAFPPASKLIMEPNLRRPALHRVFWKDVESGKPKSAEFRGELVGGVESFTFQGDLFGGLYHAVYRLPARPTGQLTLALEGSMSFQSWNGIDIRTLPYLDQYLSLCKALAEGQKLSSCLEIDGRELCSTSTIQLMAQGDAQAQANSLAHIDRVRALATALKVLVPFQPILVSREDAEFVFHTWLWLCKFRALQGGDLPVPSATIVPGDKNEVALLRSHVRDGKSIVMKLERYEDRPLPLLGQFVEIGPLSVIWSSVVPKIKGRPSAIRLGKPIEFEATPTKDCTLSVFVESATSSS